MDLDGKGDSLGIAVETVDVVVDKDLELEWFALRWKVTDLPIFTNHLGIICPGIHLDEVGKGVDMDPVFHETVS